MIELKKPGILTNETNYLANADMIFLSGYRYKEVGNRDEIVSYVKQAYETILSAITKFYYYPCPTEQPQYRWQASKADFPLTYYVFENSGVTDIELMKDLSIRCFKEMRDGELRAPFGLACVINPLDETQLSFITLSDHVYLDARSADLLFLKFIEYVNALVAKDVGSQEQIVKYLNKIYTPDFDEFTQLVASQTNIELNSGELRENARKTLKDLSALEQPGNYQFNPRTLDNFSYKDVPQSFVELDISMGVFNSPDIKGLSKNSIICAILAKAYSQLEQQQKEKESDEITMGMVMSLGDDSTRQRICGNYVILVPVTVNHTQDLQSIAASIQSQINKAKPVEKQLGQFAFDLELFEFNISDEVEIPFDFYTTNWSSYQFANTPTLDNARADLQFGMLNLMPRTTGAANCLSRQNVIICNGPEGRLYLSIVPALDGKKSIDDILNKFEELMI